MMTHTPTPVGICIAKRSTRGLIGKPRWTEMSVWLAPQDCIGPRWQGLIVGMTTVAGETPRASLFTGYTLDEVLNGFANSIPALELRTEARSWAAMNPDLCASRPIDLPFTGSTDMEALTWLYGAEALQQRGIYARIAEDFGIGESTIRQALQRGTGLRLPLVDVARFIDRIAFHKARDLRAAMKQEEATRG